MINSTLDKRVAKNLKRFEKADHNWQKADVIHSLIHKITEVYSITERDYLNELEVNTVEDLWCDLYLMVEEVAEPIRERKGSNIFKEVFGIAYSDF